MRYKNVIFDFDGTLADTAGGIVRTFSEALRKTGFKQVPEEAIVRTIGLPMEDAVMQMGFTEPEDIARLVSSYRELFVQFEAPATKLFDGVRDSLDILFNNGVKMAIATSRGSRSLDLILDAHLIRDYFQLIATVNLGLPHKPAPDLVNYIVEKMQINPEETLVVGDTTFDVMMGNGAHCHSCGVTYGNHTREMLASANPDYIIDNMRELVDKVLRD